MSDALSELFAAIAPSDVDVRQADMLEAAVADAPVTDGSARKRSVDGNRIARGTAFQRALARQVEATREGNINVARLPWPADWFSYTDAGDAQRCRKMWGEVLLASVREAIEICVKWNQGSLPWIGTADYFVVCDMIGFDRGFASTLANALQDTAKDPDALAVISKRISSRLGVKKGSATPQKARSA